MTYKLFDWYVYLLKNVVKYNNTKFIYKALTFIYVK